MTATPYLTAADLRDLPLLDDEKRFTDDLLESLVTEFEDVAERYRGVAFTPRTATYTAPGSCGINFELPHRYVTALSAVSFDGVALSTGARNLINIRIEPGRLERGGGWMSEYVVVSVSYTHGLTAPSAALLRACREYVRATALEHTGNQPRNTISYQGQDGFTYRESTPDWSAGRPTGFLAVDRVLNSLRDYRMVIG